MPSAWGCSFLVFCFYAITAPIHRLFEHLIHTSPTRYCVSWTPWPQTVANAPRTRKGCFGDFLRQEFQGLAASFCGRFVQLLSGSGGPQSFPVGPRPWIGLAARRDVAVPDSVESPVALEEEF